MTEKEKDEVKLKERSSVLEPEKVGLAVAEFPLSDLLKVEGVASDCVEVGDLELVGVSDIIPLDASVEGETVKLVALILWLRGSTVREGDPTSVIDPLREGEGL